MPISPGTLILVVGPSGAGKDTLIAHARAALDGIARVTFARRIVTRPSNAAEDHDTLTQADFHDAQARGHFALCWQAHGLDYAIPIAVERALAAGGTVVCNVSRGVVDLARARYPRTHVIYVDAALGIRMARIAGRGRRSEDASRAWREQDFTPKQADTVIDNGGPLDLAAHAFLAAVRVQAGL